MTALHKLKARLLADAKVRAEYDALAEEFAIAEALIRARAEADMTQEQVAAKMKTSQSYVAKLESGKVSPTMQALQRYAKATGTKLKITLEQVPRQ
jgi:predicted transcriptional regulator